MWATNTARICVFFSTSVLGQKGTPPPPTSLDSSVCCQSFSFSFGALYCTLENCLNRRDKKETLLIVRPGLKIQSLPFSPPQEAVQYEQ